MAEKFLRLESSMRFTYKVASAVLAAATLLGIPANLAAQHPFLITKLTVEKKPGHNDGAAMATVGNRTGRIANHALQAWIVLGGNAALLLLSPEKQNGPYRLRYYQADEAKGRLLGYVPFREANLVESQSTSTAKDFIWAFALSGTDPSTNHPIVFAGDTEAIHARFEDATSPQFAADSLSFSQDGQPKTISISLLVGNEVVGRIYKPAQTSTDISLLQFLPDGDALTYDTAGHITRGRWLTDGSNFTITASTGPATIWQISQLQSITGIPAASRISVRLLQPLSSRTAKKGMVVKAVSITPGISGDAILIPQSSEFDGTIVDAHGVGWGIKHETAALTIRFNLVKLPDGRTLPIDAHIFEVENAREKVNNGKIQGIRATGTVGHAAENRVAALVQIDPIAYTFTSVSGPAVLGFAESEILYNAGSEMLIEFDRPVITSQQYADPVPSLSLSGQQADQFNAMVQNLPYRTRTKGSNKPSDLTNLIFIGSPEAVHRAFTAAGWSNADVLDAASTFQTVKALSGNQTYEQAPMSTLLLDERPPLFTVQKSTNTFSSRHHVRVFATGQSFDRTSVLTASSTQDVAIAFSSRQKTFIHVIDRDIDNERSKVTNDLLFTGCVDAVELVQRPWVPHDAYNSTGDRLVTDGDAAVFRFNDCTDPHTTPTTVAKRPPEFERGERNFMLTLKDTLYRGNVVYEGIDGGQKVHGYLASRGELGPAPTNWRKSDASGTQYEVYGQPTLIHRPPLPPGAEQPPEDIEPDTVARAQIESHRWDPPRFELGLNFGYSRYRNSDLEATVVELVSTNPKDEPYLIFLTDNVYDGWAAGVTLTINSWNWISNEFSYEREQTKFDLFSLEAPSDPNEPANADYQTVGLATRRFAYNTVVNLRPRKSRWRPYIDAGPAFQLIALANAPLKKPSGLFLLGLSNIGLLKAAFDFGNTPPLNGGGIFQFGLQYGAGFKYRLLPRLTMRVDYGETWSKNPKIIRDSYINYEPPGLDSSYKTYVGYFAPLAKYVQQRATAGFAFTF
jgi:LssY C-terminus/Outer membrane protein beta-barrel domain